MSAFKNVQTLQIHNSTNSMTFKTHLGSGNEGYSSRDIGAAWVSHDRENI